MSVAAPASTRAQILFRRTYARPLDDEGTRFETFEQAIDRVVGHQRWLWERALGDGLTASQEVELEELRRLMLDRKASVSGRVLWLGGTETIRRRESSGFNCAYLDVRTIHDVVDAFWLLLQGTGVGFRPIDGALSGFTRKMEVQVVRSTRSEKGGVEQNRESYDPQTRTWTIAVGDSAEAWAKSVGKIVAGKFPAQRLVVDLSAIRPAGSRLRGYGWICQGDALLAQAIEAICGVMNRRVGRLLSKMDIMDIVNWLGTVLANRRSAQIALVDYGDPEWRAFATRKYNGFDSGSDWYRGQSNNSIVFNERPTKRQIAELLEMMVANGGGEPGFVNAAAARQRAPWWRGGNPCMEITLPNNGFCVSGDTPIITRDGIGRIVDLVGRDVEVWNGERWSMVTPRQTGSGVKLLRVSFGDGSYLDCTEYHRFSVRDRFMGRYVEVQAKDLMSVSKYRIHTEPFRIDHDSGFEVEDAYTLGVLVGDGHVNAGRGVELDLYGVKIGLPVAGTKGPVETKPGYNVPSVSVSGLNGLAAEVDSLKSGTDGVDSVFSWSRRSILDFLAGWLDADGSETGTGGVRLYLSGHDRALRVQLLLSKCGIRSSVCLHQEAGSETNYGVRKADSYYVQIADCADIPCRRLDTSGGHEPRGKGKRQIVTSVVPLPGLHDVYCFNEPERHMAVFGNTLTYQCNLVELTLARFRGDDQGMHRALYLLARANYRQTLVDLRDGVLQATWHEQNEFLRLCGVGLTGIAQRPDLSPYDFRMFRNSAVAGAYSMADELGLERPKAVTTVKPSGTLSKAVFDSTEGAHKPKSRYIFNTVSFNRYDPLVPRLSGAGYRCQDHPTDAGSVLVVLPVKYDDVDLDRWNGLEVDRESAVDQLERYRMLQRNYVDHNTSITVSYDPSEVPAIASTILSSWDDYVSCSFLFRDDPSKTAAELGFAYLPQRAVTPEEYESYVASIGPIDLDSVEDSGCHELDAGAECAGGACPVK